MLPRSAPGVLKSFARLTICTQGEPLSACNDTVEQHGPQGAVLAPDRAMLCHAKAGGPTTQPVAMMSFSNFRSSPLSVLRVLFFRSVLVTVVLSL